MTRLVNVESESAAPNTDHSAVTLESKVFNAIEGSNTVKVDITGPRATATFASMPVYYACSNLGKTSDEHKTVAKGPPATGISLVVFTASVFTSVSTVI